MLTRSIILLFALLLTAPPMQLAAGAVVDYSRFVREVAYVELATGAEQLVVDGDHVFVGTQDQGLLVYDASDPLALTLIGSYPLSPEIRALVVRDGILYVTVSTYGEASTHGATSTHRAASTHGAESTHGSALIAGVLAFDVSIPETPTLLGGVSLSGSPRGLELAPVEEPGQLVYVAEIDGFYGAVYAIDFTDPTAPVILGSLTTWERTYDVAIRSGYLYVARHEGTLVVDARDPTALTVVGVLPTEICSFVTEVVGDILYVGDTNFRIFDISNPAAPELRGTAYVGATGTRALQVAGNLAYLGSHFRGMYVVDVADPWAPVVLGGVASPYYSFVSGVGLRGDHAILTIDTLSPGWGLIETVDVSEPTSPVPLGFVDLFSAQDVAVAGDRACVADGSAGLRVIDVSDRTDPSLIGTASIPGLTVAVDVALPYAFAVSWNSPDDEGLFVVDVSGPGAPVVASRHLEDTEMYGVTVAGDYAYVAADMYSYPALLVFDISNPQAPVRVGTLVSPGYVGAAKSVAIDGDFAYLCYLNACDVIDISDPTYPRFVAECPLPAVSMRVRDGWAYAACSWGGFQIADVSDPTSPTWVADVPLLSRAWDLDLAGRFLYAAAGQDGVGIVDISDPTAPVLIGGTIMRPDQIAECRGIAVHKRLLYVADFEGGLAILPSHVSMTYGPVPVSEVHQPLEPPPAVTSPDGARADTWLEAGRPNPFRSRTELTFSLAQPGRARLTVYDVAGRLVRRLVDEVRAAGRHTELWDGRDGEGQAVPAGVYFTRLETGDDVQTRKTVLLSAR